MTAHGMSRTAWDDQPPPVHERRFLIRTSDRLRPESAIDSAGFAWQQAYVGAVFVSVGGERSAGADDTALVRSLLDAGYSAQHTTFFSPRRVRRLPELATLTGELWRRTPDSRSLALLEEQALAVAELLAVGATDAIGIPPLVVGMTRTGAAALNRLLMSNELPLPIAGPPLLPSTDSPAGPAPAPPVRPPRVSEDRATDDEARRLLHEGELAVSLECDQLIDLLCEIPAEEQPD
jgi:hypothetical protein